MIKKIIAALLCAASVLTISGCSNEVDLSGLIDDGGSGGGKGKGKRPGQQGGAAQNPDGSINWESVEYADEEDFEWKIGMSYDVPSIHLSIQTVYITKYIGEDKIIKIPETIEGKPVTGVAGINNSWGVFMRQSDISVCTPSSVSTIENCFVNCENATLYISEPKAPEEVADRFFSNNDYTIRFGSNVARSSKNVKVNMPSTGVVSIPSQMFAWCTDVDAITLPDSVTNVAKDAFDEQSIPKSITYKGTTYNASQYSEFQEVFNPTNPQPADDSRPGDNNKPSDDPRPYEDGELGHSTLKIYDYSMGYGYLALGGVPRSYQGAYTVPDNVRVIDDYAFTGCTGLITIVVHGNLSISEKAFDGYEGRIVYRGKSYKASEFNYAEVRREASSESFTDWDFVDYAPASDFEYEELGVLWNRSISITKYKGKSKTVKIPETINGIKVGSLFGKESFNAVFNTMPDLEVLLPEGVELKNVFNGCGGSRLYLPESKIFKDSATYIINNGIPVVYNGEVYNKEHLQEFYDALEAHVNGE